jgi:hypothetical protein
VFLGYCIVPLPPGGTPFAVYYIYIGVHIGPLCTAATNRRIVLVPGDYDDGEIGGMISGETEVLVENLPQYCYVHHKPHMPPGREPGMPRWEARD